MDKTEEPTKWKLKLYSVVLLANTLIKAERRDDRFLVFNLNQIREHSQSGTQNHKLLSQLQLDFLLI